MLSIFRASRWLEDVLESLSSVLLEWDEETRRGLYLTMSHMPAGLLQPLEMVEWKWEHVTMDFVTHLPQTQQKHDAVWVIVDRLTKSAHFLAVRMTFTLERFCRLYIREIV